MSRLFQVGGKNTKGSQHKVQPVTRSVCNVPRLLRNQLQMEFCLHLKNVENGIWFSAILQSAQFGIVPPIVFIFLGHFNVLDPFDTF